MAVIRLKRARADRDRGVVAGLHGAGFRGAGGVVTAQNECAGASLRQATSSPTEWGLNFRVIRTDRERSRRIYKDASGARGNNCHVTVLKCYILNYDAIAARRHRDRACLIRSRRKLSTIGIRSRPGGASGCSGRAGAPTGYGALGGPRAARITFAGGAAVAVKIIEGACCLQRQGGCGAEQKGASQGAKESFEWLETAGGGAEAWAGGVVHKRVNRFSHISKGCNACTI